MTISSNLSQRNYESFVEVGSGDVARRTTSSGSPEYDSGSEAIKIINVAPVYTYHGPLLKETITNQDFASDIDRYIDVEGVGTIAGTITKTGGTDAGTIKILATSQNDGTAASSCEYHDISQYGIDAQNTANAATYTDDLSFQLNCKGRKYVQINISSSDTSDDSDWLLAVNRAY
jgi:hypothetical protein